MPRAQDALERPTYSPWTERSDKKSMTGFVGALANFFRLRGKVHPPAA
jgi:hypothetical protein